MNPGNGIETRRLDWICSVVWASFKLMNPGNGIETDAIASLNALTVPFKLMNPGNGIETVGDTDSDRTPETGFQTNESWQRDWNRLY